MERVLFTKFTFTLTKKLVKNTYKDTEIQKEYTETV